MCRTLFSFLALVAFSTAQSVTSESVKAGASGAESAESFTHEQIVEAWGRIVAGESNADKFSLDQAGIASLVRGMKAGAEKLPPPFDLEKIYTDVTQFVETRTATFKQAQKERNLAAFPAYFAALKKNPAVTVLPSGLCYEVLQTGDGPPPKPEQTVTVKFKARLADGSEFDSTDQLGAVDLVLRKIVPGWSEGIQTMSVGGRVRLHVPPTLGFDDKDSAMLGIPPASTTVSEVELLAIKDTPPEEPSPPSAPVPPPPETAGFAVSQIIETWGWLLAQERGVAQAALSAPERKLFFGGLSSVLEGRNASFDEKRIYPRVAQFVAARQTAHQQALRSNRAAETAAFFEKLKADPKVVQLGSGLCYEIVRAGEGAFPKPDQRVLVNYTGTLIDGTVFDRTDPTLGPLEVDNGRVIAGWTEGMQKINRGGRIKLYIPPALAYGEIATGGIPSGSTLIFDIELLKISDVPPDEVLPTTTSGGRRE